MNLKWARKALSDLLQIKSHIHKDNPLAARDVVLELTTLAETLVQHPAKGRTGRVPNTRELIIPNLPYIIVYRVKHKQVEIVRVLHTSRKWPE